MGYRVGVQCFNSLETANDYVLSTVQPQLDSNGRFSRPEKIGSEWFYLGDKVSLTFPECSFSEQFAFGSAVAIPFLSLFVLMFSFKIIIKFLNGSNSDDS